MDFAAPDGSTQTYELAERPIDLPVSGQHATYTEAARRASTLRLRLIVRRSPDGHQTPILTNRTDLTAAQIAYRMSNRWRQENYFKYAREHFALDALDSYADQPDDPDRLVPNPAKARALGQVAAAPRAGPGIRCPARAGGRVADQTRAHQFPSQANSVSRRSSNGPSGHDP